MGCFGSRLDKRASAATESFGSVGLQFHGGEGSPEWKIAADNFVYLQGAEGKFQDLVAIYPTADGKATEDAGATAAFVAAYKWVDATLTSEKAIQEKDQKKVELVGGKFPRADVIAQLEAVLAKFKETGIEVPADAAPKTEEADNKKEEVENKGDEENKEGGEFEYMGGEEEGTEEKKDGEGDKKEPEAMAVVDPRASHVDDQEFKGFESTPALYLRTAMTSEFFGDCIKQRLIALEFLGQKGEKTHEGLAGATGYLCSGLSTSAREDQDAFFSGMVGELDEASLKELAKDAVISFPGWLQGWSSEEDATNYLKTLAVNQKDGKQVVVKITGAHVTKVLGNRVAAYRAKGKVTTNVYDEKTFISTITIAADAFDDRTVQDSHNALTEPVKPDDTKKDGADDKKDGDEKKDDEKKDEE